MVSQVKGRPCPLRPLERAGQGQHEEVPDEEEDPVVEQELDVTAVTLSYLPATRLGFFLIGQQK